MGDRLRFRFCKTGKAKYISHLDLMATMRRALQRSGVTLKYSDGFNPHPYISVALPLTVGCGSICELMDVGVEGDEVSDELPGLINAMLPEGLEILEAYSPERKFGAIAWVELVGELFYGERIPSDATARLSERFASESIVVTKKTKRGVSDIELSPHIRDVEIHDNGNIMATNHDIVIKAKVSAQNPTINSETLISALDGEYSELAPDFALFKRTELFDDNIAIFR